MLSRLLPALVLWGSAAAAVAKPFTLLSIGDSITYGCGNSANGPPEQKCVAVPNCAAQCCTDPAKIPPPPNCSAHGFDPGGCPYTPCNSCDGDKGTGSYRAPLRERLEAWRPGQFAFVGTQKGGGTLHMGFPGWRIDQIHAIRANWSALAPDAMLLMIGTNDVLQGPNAYAPAPADPRLFPQMHCAGYGNASAPTPWPCDVGALGARMDVLLGAVFRALPAVQLFVSTLTGLPRVDACYYFTHGETDQQRMALAFNALLPALLAKWRGKGFAATLVDVYNETHVGDGGADQCPCRIHPNDAGYEKMGAAWASALKEGIVLPKHFPPPPAAAVGGAEETEGGAGGRGAAAEQQRPRTPLWFLRNVRP
jgi:lysophospholipase L1-like esterase